MKSSSQIVWTSDWHLYHNNILNFAGRTAFMNEEEVLSTHKSWESVDKRDSKIRIRVDYSSETMNRMVDAIAYNINSIEGIGNKIVWNLGDVIYGINWDSNKSYRKLKEFRERLNCASLCLTWGNHDKRLQWWQKRKYDPITRDQFYDIFDISNERVTINQNGHKIIMDHYPLLSWEGIGKGTWQLHGHCHRNLEFWKWEHLPHIKQIDIGIDIDAVQTILNKTANTKSEDYRPWLYEDALAVMQARHGQAIDHHHPKE